VAEFHRLPEHPDDCRGELRCPSREQPECHGTIFHDINFYKRARGAKSKRANSNFAKPNPRTQCARPVGPAGQCRKPAKEAVV